MRVGTLGWLPPALVALALAGVSTTARAKGPAPAEIDAGAKAKAAAKFREGEKAFKRHDYSAAAAAFEEAYAIAPHPAALFNAATAHQKAGALTRAANLCARYLRDAPESDSRRDKANALIGELTPKLGRVEIESGSASDVQLDGQAPEAETVYVDPGDHVVTGKFGDKAVERKISVVAGSLERVLLAPPKKDVPAAVEEEGAGTAGSGEVTKDTAVKKAKPLSPTLFYVGLGATVVLGSVSVWSGLDTNKARSDYDQHPTQAGLDDGKSKQSRTNLLLGATAVVGVGTAVIGLFFTDFKGKAKPAPAPDMALDVGPGWLGARGTF